ncbi:recQ-mediated genome instability protein 1 [Rhizophlyctis rosea]|nr:recQ-mediated genome instability protein 1 [Rhizophlyctis rosea]
MPVPQAVTALLTSKSCSIHPEWTVQCVDYVRQTENRPLSDHELAQLVYDQYLHSDLADVGLPVLPPNIADPDHAHNIIIGAPNSRSPGHKGVVLQINDIMEVGVSVQHLLDCVLDLKPQKALPTFDNGYDEAEEPVEKVGKFPRKMLKLTLTDGQQTLPAMEYSFLPDLSLQSLLGMKIVVRNAVVRRGVMILERQNVECLGGSVSEMNEEDILMRLEKKFRALLALPPPDPPRPQNITVKQEPNARSAIPAGTGSSRNISSHSTIRNAEPSHPPAPRTNHQNAFADDDMMDDAYGFNDDDLDALLAAEDELVGQAEHGYGGGNNGTMGSREDRQAFEMEDVEFGSGLGHHPGARHEEATPRADPFDDYIDDMDEVPLTRTSRPRRDVGRIGSDAGTRGSAGSAVSFGGNHGASSSTPRSSRQTSRASVKKEETPVVRSPMAHKLSPSSASLIPQRRAAEFAYEQDPPTLAAAVAASPSPAKKLKVEQMTVVKSEEAPTPLSGVSAGEIDPHEAAPLRYLCDLDSIINARTLSRIKVKLKVQQRRFFLKVELDDGTGSVRAIMAGELLFEILGASAAEFVGFSKTPEGKTEMKRRVAILDAQLNQMDRIMELDLSRCSTGLQPVVVSTAEMEVDDCYPWFEAAERDL